MTKRRLSRSTPILPLLALALLAACSGPDLDESLERARSSLAAEDYRAARLHLQNALQADASDATARVLLGRLSLAIGNLADAERHLTAAMERGAPAETYAVPLAEVLVERGEPSDAVAMLDRVPPESRDGDYWRARGLSHLGTGEIAAAREAFDAASELGGETSGILTARAQASLLEGDLRTAEVHINDALELEPNDPLALRFRGTLRLRQGLVAEAVTDIRAAVDAFEEHGQAAYAMPVLVELVRLQVASDDLAAAEESAIRLSELAGLSPLVDYANGIVAYARADYPGAARAVEAALAKAPDVPDFRMLLGAAHLASGNLYQAELALRALLSAGEPNVVAAGLLAETQLRQGRAGVAVETLRRLDSIEGSDDPRLLLLRGTAHLQDGAPELAIAYLEAAVERLPGDQTALLQLVRAYNAAGRTEEAAERLEGEPLMGTDAVYAQHVQVVTALLGNGDNAGAAAHVEQYLADNPEDARALTLAGTFHRVVNERAEAKAYLERAVSLDPGHVPAHLLLATLLGEEGLSEQAELRLQRVLELEPGNSTALMALAQLAANREDYVAAERHLIAAVGNADSPAPRLALTRLYLSTGNLDDARIQVDAAYRLAASEPAVLATRALVMVRQGDTAGAVPLLREAHAAMPENQVVVSLLARAQIAQNDLQGARQTLRAAAETMRTAELILLLADLELRQERPAEARRLYEEVHAQSPSSVSLLGIARAVQAMGEEGAEGLARDWLLSNPEDLVVREYLGSLLVSAGRSLEALAEYERILELDPNHVVALNNGAWFAHLEGRPESLAYARRAAALAPDSAAVLDTLGWILARQGEPEEGIVYLGRAVDLASTEPSIRYHLARTQADLGSADDARATLEAVLAGATEFPEREEAVALLESL